MPHAVSYSVKCTIAREEIAADWLKWLRDKHIADVIASGAESAEIFQMTEEGSPVRKYEIRYRFKSMEAFKAYEQNHAPRLREEGLELFPLELGLEYSRTCGRLIRE